MLGAVQPVYRRSDRWRDVTLRAAKETVAQWLWFAAGISPSRVGYGKGLLAGLRALRQAAQQREIRICLLTCPDDRVQLGSLTAWTINQRSRVCTASVNRHLSRADIVWIYAQDPLALQTREAMEEEIRSKARPDVRVINPISSYNGYHSPETFKHLSVNGVSVPRGEFTNEDVGVTRVIYKQIGRQAAPKTNVIYTGDSPGMSAFEFIDSSANDGIYRRFRAYYVLGLVRPGEIFFSDHWNVCLRNTHKIQYGFAMTEEEIRQVRLIAEVLELDYFAVDFVRRGSDERAYFTDINVYPSISSPGELVRSRGDFGKWHTFDACERLEVDEPLGGSFWDHFDRAMVDFARRSPATRTRSFARPECATEVVQLARSIAT